MAAGDITVQRSLVFDTENVVMGTMEYGTAASGGIALGTAKFGLTTVHKVVFEKKSGYEFSYDDQNDKVQAWQSAGSAAPQAEVTSGDLSAQVVSFIAFGKK
jgi:VCBS repeat-containing protein